MDANHADMVVQRLGCDKAIVQVVPMVLNPKQEAFVAAYIGEAKCNGTEAARIAGYGSPHVQGARLLANVSVRARVDAYLAEVKRKGIALKENRIERYREVDARLWAIVEERAADPSLEDVPGGASGFIVRTYKMAANGERIAEYHVDTAHEASIRANLKQMAQELGEWESEDERTTDQLERRYIGVNVQVVIGANAGR